MALINQGLLCGYIVAEKEKINEKGEKYSIYQFATGTGKYHKKVWMMAKENIASFIKEYFKKGDAILVGFYVDSIKTPGKGFYNINVIKYVNHRAFSEMFDVSEDEIEKLKDEKEDIFGESIELFVEETGQNGE